MTGVLELFGYTFFQHALLAALLTSIACGITGTYIVTRRLVFLSGGITHASFGGIGIAFYLGIYPLAGAAVFAIISALLIVFFSKRDAIRPDSLIGMLWSFGMAVGTIFIFITPGYTPNLMSYLFGNILTVTQLDLTLLGLLATGVVVVFMLLYPLILSVSFDEEFARTRRQPVQVINVVLMVLVSLSIVMTIRVAGIVLVISYLTIPQAVAGIFTRRLSSLMILSVIISIVGSLLGLWAAYVYDIPSGASIIFTFILLFLLAKAFRSIQIKVAANR